MTPPNCYIPGCCQLPDIVTVPCGNCANGIAALSYKLRFAEWTSGVSNGVYPLSRFNACVYHLLSHPDLPFGTTPFNQGTFRFFTSGGVLGLPVAYHAEFAIQNHTGNGDSIRFFPTTWDGQCIFTGEVELDGIEFVDYDPTPPGSYTTYNTRVQGIGRVFLSIVS